jgi:hypothetical protein
MDEMEDTYMPPPLYSERTVYWLARVGRVLLYAHYAVLGVAIPCMVLSLLGVFSKIVLFYAIAGVVFGFAMLVPIVLLFLPSAVYYSWLEIKQRHGWLGPR